MRRIILGAQGRCRGWRLYHRVPRGALHSFRHFCSRMYRLSTMHSVADRQTDRDRKTVRRHLYL